MWVRIFGEYMTIRYLDPWGYSGNITEYQNKERPRVVGLPTVSHCTFRLQYPLIKIWGVSEN